MILKECFGDDFIKSKAGNNIEKKKIYEKVVYAFCLLEKLAKLDIDFVFKGGTSLMLLLDEFNRFSIDIDILMEKSFKANIDDKILSLNDDVFLKIEPDERRMTEIIKKHYKFYYKSIYSKDDCLSYILLDIVFDDLKYNGLRVATIESNFVKTSDPLLKVKIPSIDEMIGDKLTAFAPKTIGILYKQRSALFSKNIEIIKQLYDVSKLMNKISNINTVKSTYCKVANIQRKNRLLDVNNEECLNDSINACKLIISEGKVGGTTEEYNQLKKGYEGFKNFIVGKFEYSDFIKCAVRVYILFIKLLYNQEFTEEEKPKNCFIGRRSKLIMMSVGKGLYEELMKAIYVENNYILDMEVS